MTHYTNYDSYKLSNPDDDGYTTIQEETMETMETSINNPIFFKYLHNRNRHWAYGMITLTGHDVRIVNYDTLRGIDIDEIGSSVDEVHDEIAHVQMHHKDFQYIGMDEFMAEFNDAQHQRFKFIQDEANR